MVATPLFPCESLPLALGMGTGPWGLFQSWSLCKQPCCPAAVLLERLLIVFGHAGTGSIHSWVCFRRVCKLESWPETREMIDFFHPPTAIPNWSPEEPWEHCGQDSDEPEGAPAELRSLAPLSSHPPPLGWPSRLFPSFP